MEQQRVLVAGATGYLGQFLVKELKKRNYWVRVLIRKEHQKSLFKNVDDVFIGDITQPKTLKGIGKDIDNIISTIGITRQKDGLTYMDVDYQGNLNLLNEVKLNNIQAFQYISAINGNKLKHLKIFEAKEKFVDQLKSSGLSYQIIRPNGFFSDMKDFLDMAKTGRVYLFGKGLHKLNPIDGEDLAVFCVNQLQQKNAEISVGGPNILTQKEIGILALKAWNKPIKITHLPDWTRKLTIWILRTFTSSKTYGPYEFFLTAMANDNVAQQFGKNKLADFFERAVAKTN